MIEFVVVVLAISLFLYALLAGADFGAGIVEILPVGIPRKERSKAVGVAMGPVWESNHIWLILALVITFNAFPIIFWFVSDFLHFPLGALVIGIIFRGASFTFMHYDPIKDKSQKVYHWIFGLSSLWCTLWLGIIVGSLMLGDFSLNDQDVYSRYFAHWLNPFALSMGIFISILLSFNSALFLYVEAAQNKLLWRTFALKILFSLVIWGFLTHLVFYWQSPERWKLFFYNPLSLILFLVSALLLLPQFISLRYDLRRFSRALVGAQLFCIMMAGFAPLYPKIIVFRDYTYIDVYQAAAEPEVMKALGWALLFGSFLIFPGYFYLLKIFKSVDHSESES